MIRDNLLYENQVNDWPSLLALQTHLCEAKVGQHGANMTSQIALQRFLASHEGEAASEALTHELACLAKFVLVRLRHVVLEDQLSGRYSSNRHRAFNDRHNDLKYVSGS